MSRLLQSYRLLAVLSAVCVLLGAIGTSAIAQTQPPFELDVLSPLNLRVAPGQSVVHTLRIRNVGDTTSPLRLIGSLNSRNRFSNWPYLFGQPADPRCGTMGPDGDDSVEITTAPMAPGATLVCQWTIRRPAQSDFDTSLVWNTGSTPTSTTPVTLIGTLTDVSISTQKRSFDINASGRGVATVELVVQNRGSIAIGRQQVSLLGPGGAGLVSNDGPGGCGEMLPDSFSGRHEIPPIQPAQVFRCTFAVQTYLPYISPLYEQAVIFPELNGINGELLLDTDDSDNFSSFVVSPDGAIAAPVSLDTLDRTTRFVLSFLLGLVALFAVQRRSRWRGVEPR